MDFGPHAYHPSTKDITQLMQDHAEEGLYDVAVRQKLYISDKIMNYPFSIQEALFKLNFFVNARILLDYLGVKIKSLFVKLPRNTFKQWGIANFGRTLYELGFGKYSERVWGVSADTISVEFAKRKLPNYSLAEVLLEVMTRKKKKSKSYLATGKYMYHAKGIGRVYQNIADGIQSRGAQILYGSRIDNIVLSREGTRVLSISLDSPSAQTLACDYLVSTVPLNDLMAYLRPQTEALKELASSLQFRHGLIVNVILKRGRFSDVHWIYLVNQRFHFNRLSEQKNLSIACAPEGKTLIALERMCKPEDKEWRWEAADWKDTVFEELKFFGITEADIEEIFVDRVEKAYPFFFVRYEERKKAALEGLSHVRNLVSTGRNGLLLDIDMHDSMVLGREGLKYLLAGTAGAFYERHEAICNERDIA